VEPKLGGNYLSDRLAELSDAIDAYYGMLNLIRNKIRPTPEEIHEKPEPLIIYETCKELGISRVANCLEEQPYIWLLEWSVAKQRAELHEQLFANSSAANNKEML
jgi:hypothetical protein